MNRYQNYDLETNKDAYDYEKRQYDREQLYRQEIKQELERDYFRNYNE